MFAKQSLKPLRPTNSEIKLIQKNYLVEMPKAVISQTLGDFLETKAIVNLAITNRIINSYLKEPLKTHKDQVLLVVIAELYILRANIEQSSSNFLSIPRYKKRMDYLRLQIDTIIKNIKSTGELYNSLNNRILGFHDNSHVDFYREWSEEPRDIFIKDAQDLHKKYPHLLSFLMNFYTTYDSFLPLLGIKLRRFRHDSFFEKREFDGDSTQARKCLPTLYYFLGKYKNYSDRLAHSGFDNDYAPMINFSFEELLRLCQSSDEEERTNEHHINSCIRTFTVLMHQQHYYPGWRQSRMDTNVWGEGENFWKILKFKALTSVKSKLLEKQDAKNFPKQLEIIDRVEAGILASLLTYHYVESGSLRNFFYSLDKATIHEIVIHLIQIREGELPTKDLDLLKNQLAMICHKDKTLSTLLKDWDKNIYRFGIHSSTFEKEIKKITVSELKIPGKELSIPEFKYRDDKDTPITSTPTPSSKYRFFSQQSTPKTEPGLLARLGFDIAFTEDLKQIDSYFIQSTQSYRNSQGIKLIEIYTMIEKILKDIDQLTYIFEISLDPLISLKRKIDEAQVLLLQQEDAYDEEIHIWHNKLSQIGAYINNVMRSIIQCQPEETESHKSGLLIIK